MRFSLTTVIFLKHSVTEVFSDYFWTLIGRLQNQPRTTVVVGVSNDEVADSGAAEVAVVVTCPSGEARLSTHRELDRLAVLGTYRPTNAEVRPILIAANQALTRIEGTTL